MMKKKQATEEKKRKITEEELELLETGKLNVDWNSLTENILK